jgi:hypothetical protein
MIYLCGYGGKIFLGQCGIKIMSRSHKLRFNYHTNCQSAVSLLKVIAFDDLDSGQDEQ